MSSAKLFVNKTDENWKIDHEKAVTQFKKDVKLTHGYQSYSTFCVTTCVRDQRSE